MLFNGATRSMSLDDLLAMEGVDAIYVKDGASPGARVYFKRVDTGWPLFAFRYEEFFHGHSVESNHLLIHFTNSVGGRAPLKVPVEPIWSGLTLNTILFGSISAFVVFGPVGALRYARAHRRRTRIAAGLCPTCRYPGGHLNTCPECGHTTAPITIKSPQP